MEQEIYELDEAGEATGQVHFFCSPECRSFCEPSYDYAYGDACGLSDGLICETCGKELSADNA